MILNHRRWLDPSIISVLTIIRQSLLFPFRAILFSVQIFHHRFYYFFNVVSRTFYATATLKRNVCSRFDFEIFSNLDTVLTRSICWRARKEDIFLIGLSMLLRRWRALVEGLNERARWLISRPPVFKTILFPWMNERYFGRYAVKVENSLNKSLKHGLCNVKWRWLFLLLLFFFRTIGTS